MGFILLVIAVIVILKLLADSKYRKLEAEVLSKLGFSSWNIISHIDAEVTVKSRQALEKYDDVKYFKDDREEFPRAERAINRKCEVASILKDFLKDNEYTSNSQYRRLEKQINAVLENAGAYRVHVKYISSAGNHLGEKTIAVTQHSIKKFYQDPSLLMG